MEEKYVDVKGIRTRYLEGGTGEPLLLLHGGHIGRYSSGHIWAPTFDGFTEYFHVFAIDKIGHGFTDNPRTDEEYVIGTEVRHAYDFLNTMKINGAHLVGHSRSGYVVCRLALEHPEVVKTLVIVDSGTLMTLMSSDYYSRYSEWDKQVGLIRDVREKCRYFTSVHSFRDDHITDAYLDVSVQITTLPKFQEASAKMAGLLPKFIEDVRAKVKESHEWIRAGKLKAPTLIVWGYNDPSSKFDPVGIDTMRLILPCTPRSEMHIISEAGHYCFREQPEAFVAAVTSFIKSK